MRRALKWLAGLLVIGLILGGFAFYQLGRSGSGALEQWIGGELQSIANSYINPRLSFADLDYEYPGTVKLKAFRLTAEDPASPGATIDLLSAESATVTLGEVPAVGRPIVIEKIVLTRPMVQAIAVAPRSPKFVGFTNFVRDGVIESTTRPAETPARSRLSDVLRMRLIELVDGKIVYDPKIPGTAPMVLDQINTRLDITPDAAGAYAVKVKLARLPIFDMDIAATADLDTAVVSDIRVNVEAHIGQDTSFLPPQLQELIQKHQLRGDVSLRVRGQLPIADPQAGDVLMTAELSNANVTAGDYKAAVHQLTMQAKLIDRQALLTVFKLEALKGEVSATGVVALNDRLDMQIKGEVKQVVIDELFVTPADPQNPKLAGRVNATLEAAAPMKDLLPYVQAAVQRRSPATLPATLPTTLPTLPANWGKAELHLDRGRLVKLPVIGQLNDLIAHGSQLMGQKFKPQPTERADVWLSFAGDRVRIERFDYAGDVVAARGKGTVSLSEQLDLLVNGGPIEKLQSAMGKTVGGAIGQFTDQLLAYQVQGTIDKPAITPVVGGNVGSTVEKGVQDLTSGAEKTLKSVLGK